MEQFIKGEFDAQDKLNKNFEEISASLSEKAKQTDLDATNINVTKNSQGIAQLSNPSLLINDSFQVWQRGTSFTNNMVYTADRWLIAGDTNTAVAKTSSGVKLTIGKVGTWTNFLQRMEDDFFARLVGKTVTLTFKTATSNTDISQMWCAGFLSDGTVIYHGSKNFNNSASTNIFSMTFPITKLTTKTELGIQMKSDVAGREVEILWAKLEIGDKATPFVPRFYAEELALCQRYYQRGFNIHCTATTLSSSVMFYCPTKVTMRTTPTVKQINGTTLTNAVHTAWVGVSSPNNIGIYQGCCSPHGLHFGFSYSDSITAGQIATMWTDIIEADAEIY